MYTSHSEAHEFESARGVIHYPQTQLIALANTTLFSNDWRKSIGGEMEGSNYNHRSDSSGVKIELHHISWLLNQ